MLCPGYCSNTVIEHCDQDNLAHFRDTPPPATLYSQVLSKQFYLGTKYSNRAYEPFSSKPPHGVGIKYLTNALDLTTVVTKESILVLRRNTGVKGTVLPTGPKHVPHT